MKKLYAEREKEIAKSYRLQAEGLANDAQRKAAVDKVICIDHNLDSLIYFSFNNTIFILE